MLQILFFQHPSLIICCSQDNEFNDAYEETDGLDTFVKHVEVDGTPVKLQIVFSSIIPQWHFCYNRELRYLVGSSRE